MKTATASQLIKRLQDLVNIHGDLRVFIHDDGAGGEYAETWNIPYAEIISEYQPSSDLVGIPGVDSKAPSPNHPKPPFIQL